MGAIADFKKRRAAERAQQANVAEAKEQVSETKAPENEALALLAALLGCEVENALEKGREAVKNRVHLLNIHIDFANGEDKTAIANVKGDQIESVDELDKQTATDLEQSASAVEGAADAVTGAAEQVESAAASVEETASQLAYTAEDIGNATEQLKEATAELKKPLAARKSSNGKKAAGQKNSLNK